MAKNIVGLFDSREHAEMAVRDLRDAGFDSNDISYLASNRNNEYGKFDDDHPGVFDTQGDGLDAAEGAGFGATSGALLGGIAGLLAGIGALAIPGIGPAIAAGTLGTTLASTAVGAGIGAASGGLIGALVGAGIPEEDAHVYAESVRRGGTMVMVQADDETEVQRAVDVMSRHNVVDIDRRGQEFRQSGWNQFDHSADTNYATSGTTGHSHDTTTNYNATSNYNSTNTLQTEGEVKIPVVEEELRVGKRQVEQGGVRVETHVEERPVNEQVTLRQEHVEVHRKPVDRPVSDADLNNFQEGTFEVRERSEQAVVDKQARVVEEVHLKKNVEEHVETIQDTVRRTDVDVQQVPGQTREVSGYNTTNTTNYSGTGTTGTTGSTDEGAIERNASRLGNSVERGLDADLDNDGDVGQRDRRNNI